MNTLRTTEHCEHPDRDMSYSDTNDYDESKIAHCSACGHEWFLSQREWRELTGFDEGGKPRSAIEEPQ